MALRVSLGFLHPGVLCWGGGAPIYRKLELLWPGLDIQEVDAVGNDHDCIHDPPQLVGRNSDESG